MEMMVPARPGVYAICAQPPNAVGPDQSTIFHNLASPLYVGRSESSNSNKVYGTLQRRSTPNFSEPSAVTAYCMLTALRFWFVELPVSAIKDAEALLIRCFGPPVNKRAGTITRHV